MNGYHFDDSSRFIITDFHRKKTFSSFLPGIAGANGIPIWAFYVNRGQGISSFGIQDKNNPIMEFYPANGAYQTVGTNGFRTFIKDMDCRDVYEAFGANDANCVRKMGIEKDSFFIEEFNELLGYTSHVRYTTLSNVPFGGLVRQTIITNNSGKVCDLEIIDGMPALLPYGIQTESYKAMSNLMQSWMEVSELDEKVPFYRLRSSTKDEALVSEIKAGYFYINQSIVDDEVITIYDPTLVFDYHVDLSYARGFEIKTKDEISKTNQVFANKVPSAFQLIKVSLKPGEKTIINSVYGYSSSYQEINEYTKNMDLDDFVNQQFYETKKEINDICKDVETKSGITIFNEYVKQSYLDNVLRGGKPYLFEAEEGNHIYHIFSRKHGDLERDYNFFSLEPSKLSRGNGNYRDVNQNRRNDVIINPELGDFNIWMFYNLVQADGYNPLSVKGTTFSLDDKGKSKLKCDFEDILGEYDSKKLLENEIFHKFTPGKLLNYLELQGIINRDVFNVIMKHSKQSIDVEFGEGFWSDHFTYNLDLVESYNMIYPDKMDELLFGRKDYSFYNAPYYVVKREDRYNLTEDGKVRQYDAIAKKEGYKNEWLVNQSGDVIHTDLFNKMLTLVLTKFMNLDPFGYGIEMEGGRPGWNDALNGLPGLFGSGMSETVELHRCIIFLVDRLENRDSKKELIVLEVLAKLMTAIEKAIDQSVEAFTRWNRLNEIKENYRSEIMNVLSSDEVSINAELVKSILSKMGFILDKGIKGAIEDGLGVLPSYYINEVVDYEELPKKTNFSLTSVKVKAVIHRKLPFFLEAPARYLKTLEGEPARLLHEKLKATDIYDKNLKMFKTSESLDSETMEIGRIRAFTPGWLERESIFLHMNYKYLLSILTSGMYDEFFKEIKTNLIPFLDPAIYGRPTTENSSFIASSVNPNPDVVGQGFVARLSGSTAEVISMWVTMFIGQKGFSVIKGKLRFTFDPILTAEFFDEGGNASFTLFSSTNVTYMNPKGLDTFGKNKARILSIIIDGEKIQGNCIEGEMALKLRNKEIEDIKILMG